MYLLVILIFVMLYVQFHVHNEGPEVLEKYFPKAMLPRDYGGEEEVSEILNGNFVENWSSFVKFGIISIDLLWAKALSVS